MKNNPYFKKLKQYAVDQALTFDQIKASNNAQVANILGIDESRLEPATYANMRGAVLKSLQEDIDNADFDNIKTSGIRTWLENNFPDYEFEKGKKGGKPFVKIWYKGKPEVTDNG